MKKIVLCVLICILSLTNYQLAKFIQTTWLGIWSSFSYQWALTIPWFLIGIVPCVLAFKDSGLAFDKKEFIENWKTLLMLYAFVFLGLVLFVLLGVTRYFNDVKYPLIFFLVTPLVEELVFRGWIYGQLQKLRFEPVVLSALLFGLHHLQYFGYRFTLFAIFQMGYTFLLGLIFGLMRKKSCSIYPALVTHIVINLVSVYF